MNVYLAIITTVLVLTQIVRLIQNAIQLHRQNKAFTKDLAWIKDNDISERDFDVQRDCLLHYDAETIDEIRSKAYENGRYDATILCEEESKAAYEKGLMHGRKEATESLTQARIDEAYQRGVKAGQLAADGKSYADGFADGMKESHEYDYQNGLDIAWSAVKILLDRDERKEYNYDFAGLTASEIIHQFPVDEVVARLKTQLDSTFLCVGDEVEIGGQNVIITKIPENDPARFCYINREGSTYANNAYAEFKKTGRHFPIAALLEQMEATDEGD